MHAACRHSRWRELSQGTQRNDKQLDQCVTILRCFRLRFSSDDLKSVSSCSVSFAQRRHRSARRFQTRLFSVCEASWAMTWHSVANFRNRSAACICDSVCRISHKYAGLRIVPGAVMHCEWESAIDRPTRRLCLWCQSLARGPFI
jgi:hypothetical protein